METTIETGPNESNRIQPSLGLEHELRSSESDLEVEPLLDVEKKLIAWSLGLGVLILATLIIAGPALFPR